MVIFRSELLVYRVVVKKHEPPFVVFFSMVFLPLCAARLPQFFFLPPLLHHKSEGLVPVCSSRALAFIIYVAAKKDKRVYRMYIIDYDFPICVRFQLFYLFGSCYRYHVRCRCLPNCCHRWLNEFLVVKLMFSFFVGEMSYSTSHVFCCIRRYRHCQPVSRLSAHARWLADPNIGGSQ